MHSKRSSTAGINPKTWGAVRRLLIGTHVLPLLMHEWHSLGYRHQALDNMIDYAIKLSKDDDGVVKMPSIEFVTVE